MNPGFGLILMGTLIIIFLDGQLQDICGTILASIGIIIYFLYEHYKRKELESDVNVGSHE